jgi:hypothetical protein
LNIFLENIPITSLVRCRTLLPIPTVTNGSKDAKAAVIDSFPCCTNPRKSLADEYSSLVNEAQNLINEVHRTQKKVGQFQDLEVLSLCRVI